MLVPPNPVGAAEWIRGIDFSGARPSIASIQADGDKFVVRYLGGRPGYDITASEVSSYLAAGLKVCVVFETLGGRRALSGEASGAQDARDASSQAASVGLAGIPIHFAVDDDLSWADVSPYFDGVLSVLGAARTGIYGGIRPVRGAADSGIKYLWQTSSWSSGKWEPRATMRQIAHDVSWAEGPVDIDYALVADYGQYVGP